MLRIARLLSFAATSIRCACWVRQLHAGVCCFAFVASIPEAGIARDAVSPSGSEIVAYRESPQYCGVAAVLACLRALGEDAASDLDSLEFVSQVSGSTLADLKRLADAHGVASFATQGLRVEDLYVLPNPAVLHVRSNVADKHISHWVAYLGMDNDSLFVIYDVNQGYKHILSGELAASWDGTALVVGASEWERGLNLRTDHILVILMLLAFVAVRAFGSYCPRYIRNDGGVSSIVQFAVMAVAVAGVYQTVASSGLLRNIHFASRIAARDRIKSGCVVHLEELKRLRTDGGVVLVDARPRVAYDAGTIDGAVSLPAGSELAEAAAILERIPKHTNIVVFCGSASCSYAEQVARFLAINDYSQVCVYPGGYSDWVAAHK